MTFLHGHGHLHGHSHSGPTSVRRQSAVPYPDNKYYAQISIQNKPQSCSLQARQEGDDPWINRQIYKKIRAIIQVIIHLAPSPQPEQGLLLFAHLFDQPTKIKQMFSAILKHGQKFLPDNTIIGSCAGDLKRQNKWKVLRYLLFPTGWERPVPQEALPLRTLCD